MRRSFVVTVSALGALACQSPAPPDPTIPAQPAPADPAPIEVQSTDPTDDGSDQAAAAETSDTPASDAGALPKLDPNTPLKLSHFPDVLNDKTKDGRAIHRAWQGNGCFFYRDFPPLKPGQQRPPGSSPPQQTIACPPAMKDPAFDECRGGTLQKNSKTAECVCFVMGNPPPPVTRVGCPK